MKEIFKKTPFLKVIAFFAILVVLIICCTKVLLYRDRKTDNSSYQIINFYKEEKDSAEVVFIGSSNCFSFYSPLFAYNSYGIKTTNFSSSGMGMIAFKYAIEEVNKTQENAHIVITITPMDEMSYSALHYLADYMPMSMNKLNLLKAYFSRGDESILNSAEYFFPLMRFHERWSELTLDDLILDDGTKGATSHEYYLTYSNDVNEYFYSSEEKKEMPDNWKELMSELLDYCDENERDVTFLFPPRSYEEDEYKELNSLIDDISSRNYEVLDLRKKYDEIGLDLSYDFYDKRHTNVHGSFKYTDYVIRKIMEKYNIVSKEKNDPSFNQAFDTYYEKIKPYVLDVELDINKRDFFLGRPESLSATYSDDSVSLKWDEVKNADGYAVYRKTDNEWKLLGETQEKSFTDNEPLNGVNTYTVVSYRNDNGNRKFGNYNYKGIEVEVDR